MYGWAMMKVAKQTSAIALAVLALSITSIQSKDANYESEEFQQLASQQLRQMDLFNPRFNDLYIIESHAKNRDVIVYCNAAYCYKKRYEKLAV